MALLQKFIFLHLRLVQTMCTQAPKFRVIEYHRDKLKRAFDNVLHSCKTEFAEVFAIPNPANDKWEDVRKTLISREDMKPSKIDSMIIDICCRNKYIDAGISYYKFLTENNCKPNIVTTGKYFKLYELKETPISEEDKAFILKLYNNIKEKFPAFDYFTATSCIVGLCAIGEWKESIEIINHFETHEKAYLLHGYSALIRYLFDHGEIELAHKYLICTFIHAAGPLNYVYTSYLNYCLKEPQTFNEKINKLFNYWVQYDIKPPIETMNNYITACNNFGWNAKMTTVTLSTCLVCNQKLLNTDLSEKEFQTLTESIKKKLFVEKGYIVTHPKELMGFFDFIEKTKPYDVVIDGLNILLKSKSVIDYHTLNKLLTYYKAENKKVLVIVRYHVLKYVIQYDLEAKAKFFYVHDISEDDLFVLYAALTSGYNTKVVSEDFMRQHKFALRDAELSAIFKRWQVQRQYVFKNGMHRPMNLNQLYGTLHGAQKQNNCWHIPLQDSSIQSQRTLQVDPNHWACLEMPTSSSG